MVDFLQKEDYNKRKIFENEERGDSMDVTQKIYTIIKERHIPVKAVCEGTNLPLKVMYSSLKENGKRKLRADEFLKICKFLKINPMSLCEDKDEKSAKGA